MKVIKQFGMFNKLSKKAQNKINSYIPEKVDKMISDSIKHVVKAILVGSDWTTKKQLAITGSLYERLFLLYIFQLAFFSEDKRRETLFMIENWEVQKDKLVDMNWHVFHKNIGTILI